MLIDYVIGKASCQQYPVNFQGNKSYTWIFDHAANTCIVQGSAVFHNKHFDDLSPKNFEKC